MLAANMTPQGAEDVTTYNFRACLRELKNIDGVHKYLSVVSSWGFNINNTKQLDQ